MSLREFVLIPLGLILLCPPIQNQDRRSVLYAVSGRQEALGGVGADPDKIGIFNMAKCLDEPLLSISRRLVAEFLPIGPDRDQADTIRNNIVKDAVNRAKKGEAINLACFSWGATICLGVAQDLKEQDVRIEKMYLLDPIDIRYPGSKPPRVVPDNVDSALVIRQQQSLAECKGGFLVRDFLVPALCGYHIEPATTSQNFKEIFLNGNSDAEGRLLLARALKEFEEKYGHPPKDDTEFHKYLDSLEEIWGIASRFFGRTCKGLNATCGNGVPEPGELCDNGPNNSDFVSGACRSDCTLPRCGDHVVGLGEQCDNGTGVPNSVTSATCTFDGTEQFKDVFGLPFTLYYFRISASGTASGPAGAELLVGDGFLGNVPMLTTSLGSGITNWSTSHRRQTDYNGLNLYCGSVCQGAINVHVNNFPVAQKIYTCPNPLF